MTMMKVTEIEEITGITTIEDEVNKATAENGTGKATRTKTEEARETTAKSEDEEAKQVEMTATVKVLKKDREANVNVAPREDLNTMDGAAATVKTNVAEAPRKRLTATSERAAKEVERKVKQDARK